MYFYGLLSSTQCFYIKLNMHSSISELLLHLMFICLIPLASQEVCEVFIFCSNTVYLIYILTLWFISNDKQVYHVVPSIVTV